MATGVAVHATFPHGNPQGARPFAALAPPLDHHNGAPQDIRPLASSKSFTAGPRSGANTTSAIAPEPGALQHQQQHATSPKAGLTTSLSVHPAPSQQSAASKPQKRSVSRTISTYFKSLFNVKDDSEDDEAVAPAAASGAVSPGSSGILQSSKSFVQPQHQQSGGSGGLSSGVSFSVQASAKSSTAAIQSEVAAAMRRAQSITGRQHAPSTLLAVNRDIPPRMARSSWSLRDYAVVEKMYTGYASNVYKAQCKLSGEMVCLKAYALGNLCELNRFQIFREVKLHSSLSHENIIKLYGAFQQADQVVLVQEYAESGDLFNLLQKYGGRLSERVAVEMVLYPFLTVINYLHSNGIAHRDIKPENILFTGDMCLKLCDFGLAINMNDERAVTRAGTLEYMAPEVLSCPYKNKPDENKDNLKLVYSFHVDTWAAGVLTYELLVGMPPFSDNQRNQVEDKIRLETPKFPSKMSSLCQDFITRALEKDPQHRPTIMDMINHRWIRTLRRSASVRQLPVQASSHHAVGGSAAPAGGMLLPGAPMAHDGDDGGKALSPTAAALQHQYFSSAHAVPGGLGAAVPPSAKSFSAFTHRA